MQDFPSPNASPDWAEGRRLVARLVRDELLSLIRTDKNLMVVAFVGTDWLDIPESAHAADVLPFLSGLEEKLTELSPDGGPMTLANIGVAPTASDPVKVTCQIFREPDGFLFSLIRIAGQDELEFEVTRQVRARRLAEEELRNTERALVESATELHKANAALSRANEELDAFANVISHDLKAPLRALRLILEHACAVDQLGPGGPAKNRGQVEDRDQGIFVSVRDFERMHMLAMRMNTMISGLLTFAQIGGGSDVIETIDTGALVDRIVASLTNSPTHGGQQLEFVREGDWPIIEGSLEPLDVVLRNLISNAIKHHDRPAGVVRLIVEDDGDSYVYSVEDDGPGIDAECQALVFKPFRSASGSMADGSGLGLALVKRLCEQCGASVALSSPVADGRGARFSLAWPKNERATENEQ